MIQAITPNLPQENFAYDDIGNRTSDNNSSYVYDESKQLIKEDWKYFYVFDQSGNLTSKQEKNFNGNVQNFEYSSENQLRKFKLFENGILVKEVSYAYDALGRRIEKEVIDLHDQSKSFTRRYVYDGNEILAEYDGENDLKNSYTHSTLRTDDVLSVTNAQGTYFFVKDALGSITDITDENGVKVQHHEYSSFGKLMAVTDGAGNDISLNPVIDPYYTYTGREYDKETGLYNYRGRYYEAGLGRFISVDPYSGNLDDPLTVKNRYIYVYNNPVNFVDPDGNEGFAAAALGVMTVAVAWKHAEKINKFIAKTGDFVKKEVIPFIDQNAYKITGAAMVVGGVVVSGATFGGAAPLGAAMIGGGMALMATPRNAKLGTVLWRVGIGAGTGALTAALPIGSMSMAEKFVSGAILSLASAKAQSDGPLKLKDAIVGGLTAIIPGSGSSSTSASNGGSGNSGTGGNWCVGGCN